MSLALTAEETTSIKADMLSAFAPVSARLVRAKPTPDGTGGQVAGYDFIRTISVGITNQQETGLEEGSRSRSIVTATGIVSIDELEYVEELDFIQIETTDARQYETWQVKGIVVGQFVVRLSLTRWEDG